MPWTHDATPRVDILGVPVDAVDMELAIERIGGWIDARDHRYVCVTGVHGVMECHDDPDLLEIHRSAGMVVPDGMPLVWAGRFAGARGIRQVCGPELLPAVAARAARDGWRLLLYGGAPGVAELLAQRLAAREPGLQVVGTYTPPFRPLTPEEDAEVVRRIDAVRPDVVWVGLSTPKQERWMAAHVGRLDAPVLVGVGAAFDVHAGLRRRPPGLLRRLGLEWAYRLAKEPRRLAPRYLRHNPRFVREVLRRPPRLLPGDAAR